MACLAFSSLFTMGKPRPKGSAWARPQGWSTSAQPGPGSGPWLCEVGWFACIPTKADGSAWEVSVDPPQLLSAQRPRGRPHTGGQTERAYTGPRKADTFLPGFAGPETVQLQPETMVTTRKSERAHRRGVEAGRALGER